MSKKEPRKNYSIDHNKAHDLSIHSLNIAKELKINSVPKQLVLDTLIGLLDEKAIYKKVVRKIKNK